VSVTNLGGQSQASVLSSNLDHHLDDYRIELIERG
jgi:hypothetical protein